MIDKILLTEIVLLVVIFVGYRLVFNPYAGESISEKIVGFLFILNLAAIAVTVLIKIWS